MSGQLRMVFTASAPGYPPCPREIHGRSCPTPWGWDEQHTDQRTPYTLDQLAERPENPHRFAYPDKDAYLTGFHLWRALQRDTQLTPAEWDAKIEGVTAGLTARAAAWGVVWP